MTYNVFGGTLSLTQSIIHARGPSTTPGYAYASGQIIDVVTALLH